jgi:hypothetical protein
MARCHGIRAVKIETHGDELLIRTHRLERGGAATTDLEQKYEHS